MKSYRVQVGVDTSDVSKADKPGLNAMNIVVVPGISLAELLACHGFKIRQDCGGHGTCGKCRARVAIVDEVSMTDDQSAVSSEKVDIATRLDFREVLLCQTMVNSDMIVLLPASCFPDGKQEPLTFETESEQTLLWQQADGHSLGIAGDLGTTTLVVSLLDLTTKKVLGRATCRNPQIETGADIITRIQYATTSPSHAQQMQVLAINRIDEMVVTLTKRCNLPLKSIAKVVVSGNTAMTWFFCGLDTACLGVWPFQPPFTTILPGVNAPIVKLPSCPHAEVEIIPVLAGFLGGDILAGILTLKKSGKESDSYFSSPILYLDLGTNGELVLINEDEIFVTATAAGPAFEGAGIRFGMTAAPGAIEAVDFSDAPYWLNGQKSADSLLVNGGGAAKGICGSGLIDAVAELLRFGVIDRSGRFRDPAHLQFRKGETPVLAMISRLGMFEGHKAFRLTDESTPDSDAVWLTQGDIRAVQLAVGALRAGIHILYRNVSSHYHNLCRRKQIYLAGLFGNHIHLENAIAIGLLPQKTLPDDYTYCGNAALSGTEQYAFDSSIKGFVNDLVNRVHHIDLAAESDFKDVFINALVFP